MNGLHTLLYDDLLKCPICNLTFKGIPIVLSCCNSTVCQHHVEENDDTTSKKRKLFICVLCEKAHDTENIKKFAPNKPIETILAKGILKELQMAKETNLGDIFRS